jgi:hypothetical protein
MDRRSELLEQLANTKRQIDQNTNIIGAQQLVVDSLSARGRDATAAVQLLDSFEQSQEIWHAKLDRLLTALDNLDKIAT